MKTKNNFFEINGKNKKKVTKGYRLDPNTHKLIDRIRSILKTDYNDALNRACSYYSEALHEHLEEKKTNIKL